MRQRVMTPENDAVVARFSIAVEDCVHPLGHPMPPPLGGGSALPMVSAACAAGAAASTASVHATTTTLLIARP